MIPPIKEILTMTGFRTLQDWEQSVASDPRSQEQALEAAREQDQRKQRADVTVKRIGELTQNHIGQELTE